MADGAKLSLLPWASVEGVPRGFDAQSAAPLVGLYSSRLARQAGESRFAALLSTQPDAYSEYEHEIRERLAKGA